MPTSEGLRIDTLMHCKTLGWYNKTLENIYAQIHFAKYISNAPEYKDPVQGKKIKKQTHHQVVTRSDNYCILKQVTHIRV